VNFLPQRHRDAECAENESGMALSSVSRERSEPRKRSLEVCAPMQARG
jgi:hypothetical protein